MDDVDFVAVRFCVSLFFAICDLSNGVVIKVVDSGNYNIKIDIYYYTSGGFFRLVTLV